MALYRQQWKRDTAGNFTSADAVLLQGEPAIETDTGKIKIGDGSTAWTSLQYYGITQNPAQNIASSDYIYTFPTNPHHNQAVGLSCYGGDGSNEFIIDNADAVTVLYGNSEFDLTSKQRWGQGTMESLLVYDGVADAWRVKSYSDDRGTVGSWVNVIKGITGAYISGNVNFYQDNLTQSTFNTALAQLITIDTDACMACGTFSFSSGLHSISKIQFNSSNYQLLTMLHSSSARDTITVNAGLTGSWEDTSDVSMMLDATNVHWASFV